MRDAGLQHHKARALRQDARTAEHDHKTEAHPLHRLDLAPAEFDITELNDGGRNRDGRGGNDVPGREIDEEEEKRRQEIADELREGLSHCGLSFDRPSAGGSKVSRWAT